MLMKVASMDVTLTFMFYYCDPRRECIPEKHWFFPDYRKNSMKIKNSSKAPPTWRKVRILFIKVVPAELQLKLVILGVHGSYFTHDCFDS